MFVTLRLADRAYPVQTLLVGSTPALVTPLRAVTLLLRLVAISRV